jgi:DNA-binding NtrC family response regulator
MVKKKVVIIDDEVDLCHLMKAYLVDLNYEVYLAYNLTSGLNLLHEVMPDVLFIDNNLPDGLGWEKMGFLKENFPQCKINLISANRHGYTGYPPDEAAVNVIEKPLRLNALKEYL